jgi:4-hydroxy-tetrahydrodipicolinate synthase
VLGSEQLEDVEDGQSSLLGILALASHHDQEVVECRLVFVVCGKHPGQLDAGLSVVGICLDLRLQPIDVTTGCGPDPGCSLESVDLGVGDEATKNDQRLVGVATVDEHGGEARPSLGMVGLTVEHLAEDVLRTGIVAVQACGSGLVDHEVELVRHDRRHPVANGSLRQGPGEPGHFFTIPECDDGRNALHAVLLSEPLVGVHVDLHQLECAFGSAGDPLECRSEDVARLAPFGPEVGHHGQFAAALQHLLGEARGVDVLDEFGAHRGKDTSTLPASVDGMEHRPEAPFGAVMTAIITPFHDDGSVDYGTFTRLAEHLVAHGSDGLVVCGTTGESPTLSGTEKVALYKAAVDAVGNRAVVVAGTGTYDTRESIELTERAAEVGCAAAMAVTPYYSKPPQEGIFRHMTAIAEATDLPLMVYNIPGRTCRLIEIDTLVRLAANPKIVAVKDAVDDVEWTTDQIAALPEGFAVYSGSDSLTVDIIRAGGVGVVSVASHLAGDLVKTMVEAAVAGKDDEADRLDSALAPLFAALFVEPSPMPLKAGLSMAWDPVGQPRLPLVPASEETVAALREALVALEGL